MANANRWLALEAACRGKDSVIIRRRLEKLLPNPGIDSPTVARESVRNSRTLLRLLRRSLFFYDERGWKIEEDIVRYYRIYNENVIRFSFFIGKCTLEDLLIE